MPSPESTCWTLVEKAAGGDAAARGQFADTYLDLVRAYLGARWRGLKIVDLLDDAVQEVFLECFRPNGALSKLDRNGPAAFRSFLFVVTNNVARRFIDKVAREQKKRGENVADLERLPNDDASLSVMFDRTWAKTLLLRARELQRKKSIGDPERTRRVELLDLRFGEGLPVRDIAERWKMPPDDVHVLYRRAREEFKSALKEEIRFHGQKTDAAVEEECRRLLGMIGGDR